MELATVLTSPIPKPRLRRWIGMPGYWLCRGGGLEWPGLSPAEAYKAWRWRYDTHLNRRTA